MDKESMSDRINPVICLSIFISSQASLDVDARSREVDLITAAEVRLPWISICSYCTNLMSLEVVDSAVAN